MWLAPTIVQCRQFRRDLAGKVAFVPTMGALHAGHVSLVERGLALADHVVVSIFVNPTQFGPGEDFERYPRPLDKDLALCEKAGVTGIFHPGVLEMYSPGVPACTVNVPEMAVDLEGEFRPSHFPGVCRVVAKLLNIVQADFACFGQKDYQQLKIVQAMAADLKIATEIVGCPTIREEDGLALSSRNAYLDAQQRRHAIGLFRALSEARELIEREGETDPKAVESAMGQTIAAHHLKLDYAAIRHRQTLAKLDIIDPPLTSGVVALVAARTEAVRLIDNLVIGTEMKR